MEPFNQGHKKSNEDGDAETESSGKNVTLTREEFDNLQAKVKELEGMREQLLRSAADFENAKKRLAREKEDFTKFAQENLLRDFLPVLDNLERALAHAGDFPKDPASKGLLSGVQMVAKQLLEILKNHGVKRINALGEVFNPHHHEAIGYVEEEGKPEEVVTEVEPGYFFHDRLLRASKVRVRMSPTKQNNEDEKEEEIT